MKSFQKGKLLGKYWRIILDGTGLYYFREKHCANCLVKTVSLEEGTKVKTYYHKVLEAKIVLSDKIVISLDTEFIENETESVTKQDCEIAGKEETANIFSYTYETEEKGVKKSVVFRWLTDIELTRKSLEEMICAARGRWKIENEGFNNQKNGIYDIEHLNSKNSNAMKNHYLLTQVADIIMQIYFAWTPLRKEIHQSIKNTSSRLLESFRSQTVTEEDVDNLMGIKEFCAYYQKSKFMCGYS